MKAQISKRVELNIDDGMTYTFDDGDLVKAAHYEGSITERRLSNGEYEEQVIAPYYQLQFFSKHGNRYNAERCETLEELCATMRKYAPIRNWHIINANDYY